VWNLLFEGDHTYILGKTTQLNSGSRQAMGHAERGYTEKQTEYNRGWGPQTCIFAWLESEDLNQQLAGGRAFRSLRILGVKMQVRK